MAGIIKAGGSVGRGREAQTVAFNFDDMTDKANDYLGAVQRHAAQIVARAREEAVHIRRQAEQQGRQAALREAEKVLRQQLEQQLQTLLPALDEALQSIRQSKQVWLQNWEQNAVRLASAIAARVIRRELRQAPEITRELVREALELASGSGKITLRLHPADYQTLGDEAQQLAARLQPLAPTEVRADPQIEQGACRVDTQFGAVDQQIAAQLARIEEELT